MPFCAGISQSDGDIQVFQATDQVVGRIRYMLRRRPQEFEHRVVFREQRMSLLTNAMHAAFQFDRGEPLPEAGYQALRRVSRAIAAHHDIKTLFRSLAD